MKSKPEEIVSILREEIQGYDTRVRRDETGTVLEVGDGIATVYGLDKAVYGELVELDTGVKGMVMNLARDSVGVVLLGSESGVREGTVVKRTGRAADVPVGDGLVGRVYEAGLNYAKVLTIIDSRSAVSCLIERTRDNGICHGSLFVNDNDEMLRMNYLPTGSELNTGDRVITSGLDGIYPKGLLIGTVRSISRDSGEDDRYVVLNTAADFAHIEDVLILSMQEGD